MKKPLIGYVKGRPCIITWNHVSDERRVYFAEGGSEEINRYGRIPKAYADYPRYVEVTAFRRVK